MRDSDERVILGFIVLVIFVLATIAIMTLIESNVDTERMRVCLEAYTTDSGPIQPAFDDCMNR